MSSVAVLRSGSGVRSGPGRSSSTASRLFAGVLVVVLALLWPAGARAGSWRDPDSRVFTLDWQPKQGGFIGEVAALRDGSVLFVRSGEGGDLLWRLSSDGSLQPLKWAGNIAALGIDRDGMPLVARESHAIVERLDLDNRRRVVVADLRRVRQPRELRSFGISELAGLDDGSIIVAADAEVSCCPLWRVAASGAKLPVRLHLGPVAALAPLPGGVFAVQDDAGKIVAVRPDGSSAPLADSIPGLLAAADGGVLTSVDPAGLAGPALTSVDAAGHASRYEWDDSGTLGSGDGVPLAQMRWSWQHRFSFGLDSGPIFESGAVGADGSLLLAAGPDLRAVVPADSDRLRIAFAQASYATFAQGRISYLAGVSGVLALEVRRDERTIARATGSTTGGSGELVLPAPLPPGEYDLRLRLSAGSAITETRAHVDTRSFLPREDAAAEIDGNETNSDGDDGGAFGTEVGRCNRLNATSVRCVINNFDWTAALACCWNDPYDEVSAPAGIAIATLRRDGVQTSSRRLARRYRPPRLRLGFARHQRLTAHPSIKVRLSAPGGGRATLSAVIKVGRRFLRVRARTRELRRGGSWRAALRLARHQRQMVQRRLASGQRVTARIKSRLVVKAGPGTAKRIKWRGLNLVR
jgi:hypothetical protein